MQGSYKDRVQKLIVTFGRIVEKHRLEQGKSAYKISAESTLSKTSWREVELGQKDIQFTTLWKIAEGLDIPLGNLINEVSQELGNDFSLSDIK